MYTMSLGYTHNHMNSNRYYSNEHYPYISQAYPDPDEQLKTLLLIWKFTDIESALRLLPTEVLFQVFAPILRESYLKSLGAPVHTYTVNGEVIHTREYSIADYIRENPDQPKNRNGLINLSFIGLTSLKGIEHINNPDTVTRIDLSTNYLSNYIRPDLLSFVEDHIPAHPFSAFTNLKELDLGRNRFYALPETFFKGLSDLQTLSLLSNSLQELPEYIFQGLSSLNYLFLNNNELHGLHEHTFRGLSSLHYLNLAENQIHALPQDIFQGLSSLLSLSLLNNYIPDTEDHFRQTHSLPPSLTRIYFHPQQIFATQGHWPTHCYPYYS